MIRYYKYKVTCDALRIRVEPTTKSKWLGNYYCGEIINTGGKPFKGEDGNLWIKYFAANTGYSRYVCFKYQSKENYLVLISPQNNLDITENEIISGNEGESEEKNKLTINFNNINKINNSNLNFFVEKENSENIFDCNSMAKFTIPKIGLLGFFESQENYRSNIIGDPFPDVEHNYLPSNNQEYKTQNQKSLNFKVKREISPEIKFVEFKYKIRFRAKHDKLSFDNMMKKVKNKSIEIIIDILNIKVNEIIKSNEIGPIQFLKIKSDTENPTKEYYLDLLQRTFRQIISSNVNKIYKKKVGYNKEIIEKIYKIYEKGNYEKGIKELVDFLNMKYIDFWERLKIHMNQSDKNIISVNEKKDSNIFLTSIIEEFMPKIDEFLNKEDKEDKENYKIKFKDLLGNVSFKINNMKGDIKKK